MKLSKAQQALVDKMREGWYIKNLQNGAIILYGKDGNGNYAFLIRPSTFRALLRSGLIKLSSINTYYLTEQYKKKS